MRIAKLCLFAGVVGCGSSAATGEPPVQEGVVSATCSAWKPSDADWSSLPGAVPPNMDVPRASGDGKYLYALGAWLDAGLAKKRIFRSQDLGATWCVLPTDESIEDVVPAGPADLFATTESRKLLRTSNGGGTWVSGRFPDALNPLIAAIAPVIASDPPRSLWIAPPGEETFFVSVDRGDHWTTRRFPEAIATPPGGDPDRIHMVEFVAIDRAGGARVLVSGNVGPISELLSQNKRHFVSGDQGATWQERMLPVPSTLNAPVPIVADAGGALYAVDETRAIHRSSDWAETWVTTGTMPEADLSLSTLGSHRAGELFAVREGVTWRTIDGGATWTVVKGPAALTIDLAVEGESLLGSAHRGPISSRDGGQSWQDRAFVPIVSWMAQSPAEPHPIWGFATDPRNKSSAELRSTDGGASWTSLAMPGGRLLFDGANADVVYALPSGNAIELTEDGGLTWQSVVTLPGVTEIESGAACPPPNSCLYAVFRRSSTASTTLARTDDRGRTWRESGPAPEGVFFNAVVAVAADDPTRLFINCTAGVCESRDSGQTWTPHAFGVVGAGRVASIAVLAGGVVLVAHESGTDRQILRSEDGGATWGAVHTVRTEGPDSTLVGSRTSPGTWFLLANQAASRSDDAGATWRPIPIALPLRSVVDAPGGGFLGAVERYGLVRFE